MIIKDCRLSRAAMCFGGGIQQLGQGATQWGSSGGSGGFSGYSPFGAGQGYAGFTSTGTPNVGGTPSNTGGGGTGGTGSGGPLNTNFPNAGGYHGASLFRTPSSEVPILQNWFNRQIGNYDAFRSSDALLGPATQGALGFWNQLPGMLNQFKGFGNELQGYQGQLGGLSNQLGGYSNQLGGLQSNYGKFLGPNSALSRAYGGAGGIGQTLASHGALTPDQLNARIQQGRVTGEQSGSLHDPSAYITDYTSRKDAEDANFNQALAQSQNVLGQQQGAVGGVSSLLGQRAGITGQQAGLTQMGAGLVGQRAGLLGQQQALQTGGLNQLLGVGNAAVSQYSGLTNPILSYLSTLFGGNQQAAVSEAQIQAQQNAASSGKKGSTGGAAIGAVGSILGAVL